MTTNRNELITSLQSAAYDCQFQILRGHEVPGYALRSMYEQRVEALVGPRRFRLTPLIDDDRSTLKRFIEVLRAALSDYVDNDDRIGDGLVVLMGGGHTSPTIGAYAKNLLRPAATLGAETVVDALYGWIDGEPIRYRRLYALSNSVKGGSTSEICAVDGVKVSALPLNSQNIWLRFPDLQDTVDETELFGKALLTVEWISDIPGIFRLNAGAFRRRGHTVAPDFDVDRFCEALSLAENESVSWHFAWGDYGPLREFNPYGAAGVGYSTARHSGEKITLSKEKLDETMLVYGRLTAADARRLMSALYRWMRSKAPGEVFTNRLIELRIALEAMYAGQGTGDVTFRQATHGALHLGRDPEDRLRYRTLLKKVYGKASAVVHGDDVKPTEQNRQLLKQGQDACREGILKGLVDGRDIDLDQLMLGR